MADAPAWRLTFTAPARRDIRRLDPPIARRVLAALDKVAADPDRGQLRQLVSRPEQRLRVGDWRVLLEVDRDNREIIVHHVFPRGRAYDRPARPDPHWAAAAASVAQNARNPPPNARSDDRRHRAQQQARAGRAHAGQGRH